MYNEALARIEALPVELPNPSRACARLATTAASLNLNSLLNDRALDCATQAVARARVCEGTETLASAPIVYSLSVARSGRFDAAAAVLAEVAALAHLSRVNRSQLFAAQASVSQDLGDLEAAAVAYEGLRGDARLRGDVRDECNMTFNLAELEFERGRIGHAVGPARELLPAAMAESDRDAPGQPARESRELFCGYGRGGTGV